MAYKQIPARVLRLTFFRRMSSIKTGQNIGAGGFALLSIPAATFCLGTWQVKRLSWKKNLIKEVNEQHNMPPVELPDNLELLDQMEYRRVKLRGKFDHTKELYITPRQLKQEDEKSGSLLSSRSLIGSHVITPFYVSDRNVTILVNRGWVPKNKADPVHRKQGQVEGEIDLVGTVRLSEKRPQFSPKTQPSSREFLFRDVPKMAQMTGTAPIFLDADTSVPEGPVGGQTRITFRDDHLSYIMTWYALSAITSYVWYKKYFSKVKA